MKQKLLLKAMLLLCALIAGSSSVWAVETVYYTLSTTTAGTNNSYAGSCDVTIGDDPKITWNVTGNAQVTPWRIGGKKLTVATPRTVYSKTKMEEVITKVVFSFGASFSSQLSLSTVKLTVSTAENGGGDVLDEVTKNSGFGASQSLTFTPSTGKKWSKDAFYLLTFTFTTDNINTNRYFEFGSAVFYYDKASTANLDHIVLGGTYPTEFYVGDTFTHDGLTVTAHYDDASTLDVTSSASFSDPDMSTPGTKTVTVSFEENSVEKSATYDITVSPVPPVVLTLDFKTNIFGLPVGSSNKLTVSTGYSYGGYTYTLEAPNGFYYGEFSGYNCLFMGKSGATLTFPNYPFKVKMIKVYGTSGASGSVKQNIFVGSDAICTETTGAKDVTNVYRIPSAYQVSNTTFILKVTSDANTQISKIEILGDEAAPAYVVASGYSTLATTCGLDFSAATPAGLVAYVASAVSASAVTLTAIDEAPASTGVILKGAKNTVYTIPVKSDAAAVGTNYLHAAVTATACAADEVYILQSGQFHLVNAASTIPAGKAYLLASEIAGAPEYLGFDFGSTNISTTNFTNDTNNSGEFYNLAGQRVANPTKGLYIVNGKKVIVK